MGQIFSRLLSCPKPFKDPEAAYDEIKEPYMDNPAPKTAPARASPGVEQPVVPQDLVNDLIQARNDDLTKQWEAISAEGIASWFSNSFYLHSFASNNFYQPKWVVKQGYEEWFEGVSEIKVLETESFGTPYFTSKENLVESTNKDGTKNYLREAVLAWWRWEGPGTWNGDLSSEGIRGWKIIEQHDYEISDLKSSDLGVVYRLFPAKTH